MREKALGICQINTELKTEFSYQYRYHSLLVLLAFECVLQPRELIFKLSPHPVAFVLCFDRFC